MSNRIDMTFTYDGTDFTRAVKISDVTAEVAADSASVKTKIKAINTSLAGGTSGGMDTFFRADDYDDSDPNDVIGTFKGISAAKIVSETVTNINLDTEGDASNG